VEGSDDKNSDEYSNYDYLEDQYAEDPWEHFKKWQGARQIQKPLHTPYCDQRVGVF
jgi:hypothetical protein